MLSRHIIRILLGIAILGNAVNLLIFTAGRLTREAPAPIIRQASDRIEGIVANALPQALILTAIVISFSFFAFLLVLAYRAYQELGSRRQRRHARRRTERADRCRRWDTDHGAGEHRRRTGWPP